MTEKVQQVGQSKLPASRHWKPGETRSLNGDERISFTVFSLYLFIFCVCTYLFWPTLPMKILGGTAAVVGFMLFSTALFNRGTTPRKHSRYTRGWYLASFLSGLLVMMALRSVARHVQSQTAAVSIIYGTLLLLFLVFRKAMIQILMALLAVVFLLVSILNWQSAAEGRIGFMDVLGKCGKTIFKVEPIEEVANTLIAGNYMTYLSKVDYRNRQVNIVATRTVAGTGDDDLRKALKILDFVSNDLYYVSDPEDGVEYAKDPVTTLLGGGGDCEDKTVLLCSMLESVGVKSYMAFTADHVFALGAFSRSYPELDGVPYVLVEGKHCYMLDGADAGAEIGRSIARPEAIERIFDVRSKKLMKFTIPQED